MADNQLQQARPTGIKGLSTFLNSDMIKGKFAEVLGDKDKGIAFVTSILSVVNSNGQLAEADQNSLYTSALMAATLDLPINPSIGHAFLVPFKTRQSDGSYKTMVQFQISAKGLKQLAMRSEQFLIMNDSDVREGEILSVDRMTGEIKFNWIQDDKERLLKPVIGYISYFKLRNGFESTFYMTKEQVEAHAKQFSQTYKKFGTGLWKDMFDKMASKGLCINTDIITPTGWKKMHQLEVGSIVYDINGKETLVEAVSERKNIKCYEIAFSNGESVVCDEEHDWVVRVNSKKKMINGVNYPSSEKMNIKDMFNIKSNKKNRITIECTKVEFRPKDLPIDPYLLGYWIGNGSKRGATLSCHKKDVDFLIKKIKEAGFSTKTRADTRNKSVEINISRKDKSIRTGGFLEALRNNYLINNKHIPEAYKLSSESQRLALIRGLFDADGTICKTERARVNFGQVAEGIVSDVYEILCSLGETPNKLQLTQKGFGKEIEYHVIDVKPNNNLFDLPRKSNLHNDRKYKNYWAIKSIAEIPSTETVCIAVDSKTKTYLATKSMIPTHNTVIKLHLSKDAPLSSSINRALVSDQAVIKNDNFINNEETIDIDTDYVDNEPERIDAGSVASEKEISRLESFIKDAKTLKELEGCKSKVVSLKNADITYDYVSKHIKLSTSTDELGKILELVPEDDHDLTVEYHDKLTELKKK